VSWFLPLFAAIPSPPRSGIEIGPLDLRMYGVLIAIGAYLALQLAIKRYEGFGGDPETAEKAGLIGLLGGFLGARIGYIIPRFLQAGGHGEAYIDRPGDILAIWQGGLALFGGLIGGALVVMLYLRVKDASIPMMADAMVPTIPLAQAIGRWGNYFNHELFGRPTDLPWALSVRDSAAVRAGHPAGTTFHPTFLYESLWNLGLFGALLWIERRGWFKRRGSMLFAYLVGYGVGRAWVEFLRIDTTARYPEAWGLTDWGLSRNNWIAIAAIILGVTGLLWWERRGSADELEASEPDRTDDQEGEALDPPATGDGDERA